MATYNGYPSYNAWNVSLWINNDEGFYCIAQDCTKACSTRDEAAQMMLDILTDSDVTHTYDGVPFTKTNIRRAMIGM